MLNYYVILQVKQNATNEEIKKSFRNLAKKYHPDKNRTNQAWAEEKIKLILKAYKTLTDAILRQRYDINLENYIEKPNDNHPAQSKSKQQCIYDQIKSILNDLVHDNSKRAIEMFEKLNSDIKNFELHKFLTGRDYLDCAFLLGEEYEKSGKYNQALMFYKNIYELEKDKKKDINHNFFFDETKNRIKTIYCKKLMKSATNKQSIEYYQKVLKLHINNNERAHIYKKISECYFELGDYQCAVANLNVALNIKPSLKGINRIQTKLNQHFATT